MCACKTTREKKLFWTHASSGPRPEGAIAWRRGVTLLQAALLDRESPPREKGGAQLQWLLPQRLTETRGPVATSLSAVPRAGTACHVRESMTKTDPAAPATCSSRRRKNRFDAALYVINDPRCMGGEVRDTLTCAAHLQLIWVRVELRHLSAGGFGHSRRSAAAVRRDSLG